jgi:hypothetical protein
MTCTDIGEVVRPSGRLIRSVLIVVTCGQVPEAM